MKMIRTEMRWLMLGVTASFTMSTASVALATDGAWTNGLPGNWSAPSSWMDGVIPGGAGAIAEFIGPSWAGSNPYVTVDTNAVIGQLLIGGFLEGNNQLWHFNASAGKALTLDSGDTSPARIVGTETTGYFKKHNIDFNAPLILNSDLLLQAVRTDLAEGDGPWVTVISSIRENVPGRALIVSNMSPYAKCVIGGNNTFSGPVMIQSGYLQLATPMAGGGVSTALGANPQVAITNVPGTLDLNNFMIGPEKNLWLSGSGMGGYGTLVSTKRMRNQKGTWAGPVVLKEAATVGGRAAGNQDRGGCNLLLSGDISEEGGSFALTKAGDGLLYLTGNNSYSGGTVISQRNGFGGVNALSAANLGSGPMIFNGGTFQFGEVFDISAQTLLSTNSYPVKLDTNGKDITLAGNLTAAINGGLSKYGPGTLTLSGANTFSGSTRIFAGTLILDYTTQPNNKIAPANGGELWPKGSCTLKIVGSDVNFNQSIGKMYWEWGNGGELTVTNLSNTIQFSIGSFYRGCPATGDFATSGGLFNIGQANVAGGILGGYLTYGKTTWAINDGVNHLTGLAAYGDTWTATDNKDMTLANIGAMPADASVNTLRFNNTDMDNVPLTLTLSGKNTLASGGLLVTSNMGADPVLIEGGQLTAGSELIIHQHNTLAPLVIASSIQNSAAAVGLTKSGMGTLVISNSTSTFTGPITVNNGCLTVYSPQDLGSANPGIRLINGSVLEMVGTYSIANPISMDVVGGGVDVPAGSSITLTAGNSPYMGNDRCVSRKTGGGVLTLGNYARDVGEFSVEGGTLISDNVYKFGWAGSMITLTNNATIKKNAVLNHGENGFVLNVAGSGGTVDLDGSSATLNVADYLNGSGTLLVMNSGAGSPTFKINYQQATFTGVLDVQLGSTTFQCADIPNAVLKLGPATTWTALNAVTKLGGLSGNGTFNYGGNTVLFGGAGDSEFSGLLKGSGTLVKQGTGTWSLSSSDLSQFTGTLAISNGTFAANSIFTRPITLAGSGTLGGTGTVTQVTMTGGTLAPANDGMVGTLTIGSSLSLDGALSVDVREDGSSDCLHVSGDLTLSETSSFTVVDTNQLMRVGRYLVATWTGDRIGTFNQNNLPPKWSLGYDDTAKKIFLRGPPFGTLIQIQ